MGRTAYYKGDLEQAHQLLSMVAQQNPRHQETRILLGDIRAKLNASGSSLKKKYAGVKLAKIEFADVTLQEALDGLRVMAKNASSGQVVPNFVVTSETLKTKTLSLSLIDNGVQSCARKTRTARPPVVHALRMTGRPTGCASGVASLFSMRCASCDTSIKSTSHVDLGGV
jgi:hypothetical protein